MFNDHYEVPSSIYFCPCLNLVLSAFISVLRLKFLIAYLTSLQTFFYAYRASKQFILSFQNLQPFSPIFLIPSALQKNNGLSRPYWRWTGQSDWQCFHLGISNSISLWMSLSGNHRDLPPISSCFWDKIQQALLHCRWWFRDPADPLHLLSPPVLSP